jgi:hypothetical protein
VSLLGDAAADAGRRFRRSSNGFGRLGRGYVICAMIRWRSRSASSGPVMPARRASISAWIWAADFGWSAHGLAAWLCAIGLA